MARFNRTNFYRKEEINGILENDLLRNYYNDSFQIKRPVRYYALEKQDVQRPDLLSVKFYGRQDYWWILGKYNQVDDWWNDVTAGNVIRVPQIADIEDFYSAVRQKKKTEDVE